MPHAIHSIQTPRLTIRRFAYDDLEAASRLLDACFGAEPSKDRQTWLTWQIASYDALERMFQPPYGDYAVVDQNGALVGSVGLVQCMGPFESLQSCATSPVPPEKALHSAEMGLFWAIDPAFRRKGYAGECAGALVGWAFGSLGVHRLVATTESDNEASIGVMKALGMSVEAAPKGSPPWFQTIGVLLHPHRR